MPMLAGICVHFTEMRKLSGLLRDSGFDDTAERLEDAYERRAAVVGLTIADREAVLETLVDPPAELAQLRWILLDEHEWRICQGLA
jgi:hypothetical protein